MRIQLREETRAREKRIGRRAAISIVASFMIFTTLARAEEPVAHTSIERIVGAKRLPAWPPTPPKPKPAAQVPAPELIEVMPVEVAAPVEPIPEEVPAPPPVMEPPTDESIAPETTTHTTASDAGRSTLPATPPGDQPAAESTSTGYRLDAAQMGLIVASTIVGPILALLGALVFLRKCGVPFGPLVRVEVVNQQSGWAPSDAGEFRVEAVRLRTDARDDQEMGDGTAHHFDLGPSYEEERRMKEDALKNQEHAILQQIVDQNVQLREDIAELNEEERA